MSDYFLPFLMLVRPRQAADRLPSVVAWWRPFAVIAILAMGLCLLSHPLAVSIAVSHLPPSATSDDIAQVREWLIDDLVSRTLLLPLRTAVECACSALLLLAFSRAFTGRTAGSFRGFFVLSLAASIFHLLGRGVSTLWASVINDSLPSSLGTVLSAADLFPTGGDYSIILLLTSINLFTLLYLGSVTLGLAVLCRCSTWKAFLVAVATWTVSTAFSITVLFLLRDAYQLRF